MYVAMNRFAITAGREGAFEETWRRRESHLDEVPGFVAFHLLRGATSDGITPYVSHSTWESAEAFRRWTESEAFTAAHSSARPPAGTVAGPPRFEGFEAVDVGPTGGRS